MLLYAYTAYKGLDTAAGSDLSVFPDAPETSSYTRAPLSWLVRRGILAGADYGQGRLLDPQSALTRAQAAALLMKYYDVTPGYKEDGVLKILTIGNSFSDDAMWLAPYVAESLGVREIYFANLYGSDLGSHYLNGVHDKPVYEYRVNTGGGWSTTYNYVMADALAAQDWDFISLQQASGYSGISETYEDLEDMVGYLRSKVGNKPRLCWHMTWAYQGDATLAEFAPYDYNQLKMYNAIVDCIRTNIVQSSVPDINSMLVIPSGTAIQNARTSFLGDTLTRDGYHLTTDVGRYIAALTLVNTLTGLRIDNIGYAPDEEGDDFVAPLIEVVKNAAAQPFVITPSVYTVNK